MANKTNSLSHTKWMCKYHIVFIPKYRRKAIYGQYRADLQEIIRTLCKIITTRLTGGYDSIETSIRHRCFNFLCLDNLKYKALLNL